MTLLGLESQFARLHAGARSGRLHHAWLLHGPRGVGKASFAKTIGAQLLVDMSSAVPGQQANDVPPDHPAARLIAAHSHPDYLLIEREVWDNNRIIPFDRRKPDDTVARNIRIAQIRALVPILSMAPSVATRRMVIIDAADDLEASAANALLKNLEEPPANTVFLLVAHAPGRLLPTIRSRCRALAFPLLADSIVEQVLVDHLVPMAPAARDRVVALAAGSPGVALAQANDDVLAIEGALDGLVDTGDPKNAQRLELATRLGTKAASSRYESFLQRGPNYIAARARSLQGRDLANALLQWERAQRLADVAVAQSLPAESVVFEMAGYVAALAATTVAARS